MNLFTANFLCGIGWCIVIGLVIGFKMSSSQMGLIAFCVAIVPFLHGFTAGISSKVMYKQFMRNRDKGVPDKPTACPKPPKRK